MFIAASAGLYSLFNLERILLANFLMSAMRSSSSAFVSERREEKRLVDKHQHYLTHLHTLVCWPISEAESILKHKKWCFHICSVVPLVTQTEDDGSTETFKGQK